MWWQQLGKKLEVGWQQGWEMGPELRSCVCQEASGGRERCQGHAGLERSPASAEGLGSRVECWSVAVGSGTKPMGIAQMAGL